MSAALTLPDGQIVSEAYINWQAAFVEDAVCIHLHTKAGFSNLVLEILRDVKIQEVLISQEHFGPVKYNKVLNQLEEVVSAKKL